MTASVFMLPSSIWIVAKNVRARRIFGTNTGGLRGRGTRRRSSTTRKAALLVRRGTAGMPVPRRAGSRRALGTAVEFRFTTHECSRCCSRPIQPGRKKGGVGKNVVSKYAERLAVAGCLGRRGNQVSALPEIARRRTSRQTPGQLDDFGIGRKFEEGLQRSEAFDR